MAILTVLTFPDPRLRITAKPVEKITSDVQQLLDNMLETMYAEKGIGLAAIQINIPLCVIVIDLSETRDQPYYIVNPEILETEGLQQVKAGCLSIPEIYDTVPYPERIRIRYINREGDLQEITAKGLLAACIQHEIDHLNGKLFIDYLSLLKRQRIEKKLKNLRKSRI